MNIRLREKGFTLIEALIALVVLSIGLLGVAAMQLKALQSAHMGYQRSVVSLAAIDAQERAWAELEVDSCPSGSGIQEEWLKEWFGVAKVLLDAGGSQISGENCEYEVTINWVEKRDGGEADTFHYVFRLPEL